MDSEEGNGGNMLSSDSVFESFEAQYAQASAGQPQVKKTAIKCPLR